jgi:hypothetical protein
MSAFMPKPSLLLPDKHSTLEALTHPTWLDLPYPGSWHVKSLWICNELNTYETTIGFPYNSIFQRWIEQREHLAALDINGSPLSLLIYNAQRFRESDRLQEAGWQPGTQRLLEQAYAQSLAIETLYDTLLGSSIPGRLIVIRINGTLYACQPRSRRRVIEIIGRPCRLLTTPPNIPQEHPSSCPAADAAIPADSLF